MPEAVAIHGNMRYPGKSRALAPLLTGKALAGGGRGAPALHGSALVAAGNTPKCGVN